MTKQIYIKHYINYGLYGIEYKEPYFQIGKLVIGILN